MLVRLELRVETSGPTSRCSLTRKCFVFRGLRAKLPSYVSPIRQFGGEIVGFLAFRSSYLVPVQNYVVATIDSLVIHRLY